MILIRAFLRSSSRLIAILLRRRSGFSLFPLRLVVIIRFRHLFASSVLLISMTNIRISVAGINSKEHGIVRSVLNRWVLFSSLLRLEIYQQSSSNQKTQFDSKHPKACKVTEQDDEWPQLLYYNYLFVYLFKTNI